MHPAYEGLSAMPFYDDFDLSTVDVLLISQYVSTHLHLLSVLAQWWRVPGISLQSDFRRTFWLPHHVYQKQWNIICIIQFDSGDVPPVVSPLSTMLHNANKLLVSTLTMLPLYLTFSPKQTSRAVSS
jgi:hypothetical protein